MSKIQPSIICIISLCLILMSDVSDAKCNCCEKINDYCCKTADNVNNACCATDGNIESRTMHDWKDQCGTNTIGMCKTDGDCRKRNPGMDCVRNHRTVYSKVYNGKMLVFWKEWKNEGGKCALALTPGEQQICRRDSDCHKDNSDMVCVRSYGTIITKIVDGKIIAKRNMIETETGKCTLENKLPNIVESAAANPELSILSSILTHLLNTGTGADWLVDTLEGKGPFTVFAPNNDAFNKLPKDKLANLKKPENVDQLKAVLQRHVVPGELEAIDIPKGTTTLKTLGGGEIVFNDSGVRVANVNGNANVIKTDIMAGNGVIHVVDTVI